MTMVAFTRYFLYLCNSKYTMFISLQVTVNFLLRVHSRISTVFTQSISPTYIFSHHLLAKVVKRIASFRNPGDKESMQTLSKIDFDYYFACDHEFVGKRYECIFFFRVKPNRLRYNVSLYPKDFSKLVPKTTFYSMIYKLLQQD